jgi:hypothetical protein
MCCWVLRTDKSNLLLDHLQIDPHADYLSHHPHHKPPKPQQQLAASSNAMFASTYMTSQMKKLLIGLFCLCVLVLGTVFVVNFHKNNKRLLLSI